MNLLGLDWKDFHEMSKKEILTELISAGPASRQIKKI
jgi:hypothetical protein